MTNLKEVTDTSDLWNLRYAVQQSSPRLLQSADAQLILEQAWRIGDTDFYTVRLHIGVIPQIGIEGVMLFKGNGNCQIFLDSGSVFVVVSEMIDARLEQFNAGKHWKFKGV